MELVTVADLAKEQCTGCWACLNRCPTSCISMETDQEGFFYPVINTNQCIQCSKCVTVCPVLSPVSEPLSWEKPKCYAAWSKNESVRFHSTSGGVFTHLAEAVFAEGGMVAGAQYRKDHLVEHVLIHSSNELEKLRQSKYVQSEAGYIYRQIQAALKSGTPVLFVGTPCQCAALNIFLGQKYDHLYLCDFICRGVNSPKVYLAYLKELERTYRSPIKQVWFKNKTHGWNHFCTKILFENGEVYLADRETDPFMLGYIKRKISCYMRPSCYQCSFKGVSRPVDLTLGDFWGIENLLQDIDVNKGVSVVIIHSEKGKQLWHTVQNLYTIDNISLEFVKNHNACIINSVPTNSNLYRSMFFSLLDNIGYFKARELLENKEWSD